VTAATRPDAARADRPATRPDADRADRPATRPDAGRADRPATRPDAGRPSRPAHRTWRTRGGLASWRWHPRAAVVATTLVVLLVPVGVATMTTGTYPVHVGDVLAALGGDATTPVERVLLGIRLPRFVAGVVVGAALGIAGAVFQTISRNPLGSPDVIGFTTGAATGAIIAITAFAAPAPVVAGAAVVGGLVTALATTLLATRRRSFGGYRLVLVGIGVGALLNAVNDLLLTRSQRDDAIGAQTWLVGTLNARGWDEVLPTGAAVAVLVPVLLTAGTRLRALELGDDMARQTGVAVDRVRLGTIAVAVALVAFATATAGPIAFVALAAPQLALRLTRGGSLPLFGSAALGALLLTTADLGSQWLPLDLSAPVGLVTGVLGGAYLLWLLTRGR